MRNIRRQARQDLEALEKSGDLSKDDLARAETDLDGATKAVVGEVDSLLAHKETELLEV